jgi:hypothetical protein
MWHPTAGKSVGGTPLMRFHHNLLIFQTTADTGCCAAVGDAIANDACLRQKSCYHIS